MASTIMASNKCEATVYDIKKPKNSTPVRRWLHVLKHAAFKNRHNDADALKVKVNHVSTPPCSPKSSTTEGESDAVQAEVEAKDPKEHTRIDRPSSTATPNPKPTTVSESLPPRTLLPVPEGTASPDAPQASSHLSVPAESTRPVPVGPVPSKGRRSRQPRKPTLITPEFMQQIQSSNRKHSGASLLNGGEFRTKAMGTATATNRAKDVVASPLRWFEK